MSELEAELAEQSHLRLQAAGESEFLKAELEDLRRVREDTEKEHRSVTEIESKPDPSVRDALMTCYLSYRHVEKHEDSVLRCLVGYKSLVSEELVVLLKQPQ